MAPKKKRKMRSEVENLHSGDCHGGRRIPEGTSDWNLATGIFSSENDDDDHDHEDAYHDEEDDEKDELVAPSEVGNDTANRSVRDLN
jgi:hypothetical protein